MWRVSNVLRLSAGFRHPAQKTISSVILRLCRREARLYIVSNGQGSPCLDLRRVPASLADATVGTDLVILEGTPPAAGSEP